MPTMSNVSKIDNYIDKVDLRNASELIAALIHTLWFEAYWTMINNTYSKKRYDSARILLHLTQQSATLTTGTFYSRI